MILVLGGTAEARELAAVLHADGLAFISSLAGRVARPRLPAGEVRIGGFGGVPGLRSYIRAEGVEAVVDATHPFATGMTANARAACSSEGIPLLRLERPGWAHAPGADGWHWVDDHASAGRLLSAISTRPFLTVGRQELGSFTGPLHHHYALARVVDTPSADIPDTWTVLLSRGPYDHDGERALMDNYGIDALVTKDSGGDYTWPKMAVAAERGTPVIVVRRAPAPAGDNVTHDVRTAIAWARAMASAVDCRTGRPE